MKQPYVHAISPLPRRLHWYDGLFHCPLPAALTSLATQQRVGGARGLSGATHDELRLDRVVVHHAERLDDPVQVLSIDGAFGRLRAHLHGAGMERSFRRTAMHDG